MIKNGLTGCSRFLLTVFFLSVAGLMSGCCSFCDLEKNCKEMGFINRADCPVEEAKCPEPEVPPTECAYDDMDIVYAFKVPETQDDCPTGTTFTPDVQTAGLEPHQGGAGIIDRSGGAGIIDRQGEPYTGPVCLIDCMKVGDISQKHVGKAWIRWDYDAESEYVVAESVCQ